MWKAKVNHLGAVRDVLLFVVWLILMAQTALGLLACCHFKTARMDLINSYACAFSGFYIQDINDCDYKDTRKYGYLNTSPVRRQKELSSAFCVRVCRCVSSNHLSDSAHIPIFTYTNLCCLLRSNSLKSLVFKSQCLNKCIQMTSFSDGVAQTHYMSTTCCYLRQASADALQKGQL